MKLSKDVLRWVLFLPFGALIGFLIPDLSTHLASSLAEHSWWGSLVGLFGGYWHLACPYRVAKWIAPRAEDNSRDAMKGYCCLLCGIQVIQCICLLATGGAAELDVEAASASEWWPTICFTLGSLYGFVTVLEEDGPAKLCRGTCLEGSDLVSPFDWCEPVNIAKA